MNMHLYGSFVFASLIVLMIPGPSFAYAIAVGVRNSRRVILYNALGMALGGCAITLALAFGVAQIFASYPIAFVALKVVGCAYLFVLGVRTFFIKPQSNVLAQSEASSNPILQGFVIETANPKAILFYISLIPQFADPQLGHMQLQLFVLGVTFVALQVAWDIALMLGVHKLGASVTSFTSMRSQRIINRISGATFVSLGLILLAQERTAR
ncbi:LysE family translocator [Enterobacterales bacterium AW_CKDN230030176-1A_HGKHYDSX7]